MTSATTLTDSALARVESVTGQIEPRDLRVSDAEREHVGQLLQRAVSEGRITIAEFDTRMAAAMAARTRGELNAQVLDIAEAAPEVRPKDVLELRSGMGNIKRRGYWVAPPTIKVSGWVGDTLLDFTDAQLVSAVTTIDVKLGLGKLIVVVPPGSTVDYDDMHMALGEIKDRTEHHPSPGAKHFIIRGTSGGGDVKIMNPRSWRCGPLTVHRPFRLMWGRR
jgi:Domain of unknown function (DUF1707)